jgi:hypothetical protein
MTLSDEHRQYLNDHAVSDYVIDTNLITSEGNEILFPWRHGDRHTIQRRPWPGESGLYYWEKDKDLHLWELNDAGPGSPVLIVEGTKQSLAAASYLPGDYTLYGMAGCFGWSKINIRFLKGRDVYLCLDADAASNLDVYEAGEKLGEKLKRFEVTLRYLRIPGTGSQGLDDYLASLDEDDRADILRYEIANAAAKPADKRPAARKRKMEMDLPDLGDRVGVAINLDRKEVIDKITNGFLDRWDGHTLFNYGDIITRVQGHETQPLDRDRFYAMLADTAACFRYSEATDRRPAQFEPAWPDPPTIGAVMSKADEFSPLSRVVRIPFLRPDGTVCSTPGYDRDTQTVLVPSGLEVTEVAQSPTSEQTRMAAKYLMEEWLGDLPFKTDADRANALALVLTPFIRGIVPLAPMAVVSGLQMGVGKNLLADCLAILATGHAAMPLPYVGQEEEMRKQLTAAFASGAETFVFDEAHVIEGAQLARAVTSLTYGDRVLGVSRIAKFPNRVTWMALGNQVQVNGDMSRRVYFIYLHPSGVNVMDREAGSFRHPDLKEWTADNRDALVSAALTVLRGWWAAGRPGFSRGACMGSFEPWDRMMSGVLAYAGMPAFLTDMKERRSESDFTASYWSAHIHWLRSLFGDEEFTTRQVQEAALKDPRGYEAPPELDDASGKVFTRQLGQAYSKHRDRNYDGVRLVKSGMGHKSTIKWRTTSDDGGREVDGGNSTTPPVCGEPPSGDACEDTRAREQAGSAASTSLPTSKGSSEPVALGFDIETASAGQLFTGGHPGPYVRLCGVTVDRGVLGTWSDVPTLTDALNEADVIYGHGILDFDLVALARYCGADYDALAAKAVDTKVRARLADPPMARDTASGGFTLDDVAKKLGHTGKSDDLAALAREFGEAAGFKGKEAETQGYALIPVDDPRYVAYLHGDLNATAFVFKALPEMDDYAWREMRVVAIQNRMTLNGWGVNRALLAERVTEENDRRAAAVARLRNDFGMPTEKVTYKLKLKRDWPAGYEMPASQAREWLAGEPEHVVSVGLATERREPYAKPWSTDVGKTALIEAFASAGAKYFPRTASGDIALGKAALNGDDQDGGRWYNASVRESQPSMIQKYGHLPAVRELVDLILTANGTSDKYAEIARHVTSQGRVHPRVGAPQASGRWGTTEPSTTNTAKRGTGVRVRDVFDESDRGLVHVACDLSQVDMRAMAALSQDPAYMALFEPGRDAHMEMAEVYFGERTKEARHKTKAFNHAGNYGQGAKAVSERTGIPLDKCYEIQNAKAEAYPRLAEYIQEVRELAESGALLDNGFGRKMRPDPARAYTQGPALMGQGAARDIMCEALLRLVDMAPEATQYLRGVIHDEAVLCVPEHPSVVELWRETLRKAFTFEWRGVPILCEVSQPGASWADCYAGE